MVTDAFGRALGVEDVVVVDPRVEGPCRPGSAQVKDRAEIISQDDIDIETAGYTGLDKNLVSEANG